MKWSLVELQPVDPDHRGHWNHPERDPGSRGAGSGSFHFLLTYYFALFFKDICKCSQYWSYKGFSFFFLLRFFIFTKILYEDFFSPYYYSHCFFLIPDAVAVIRQMFLLWD